MVDLYATPVFPKKVTWLIWVVAPRIQVGFLQARRNAKGWLRTYPTSFRSKGPISGLTSGLDLGVFEVSSLILSGERVF